MRPKAEPLQEGAGLCPAQKDFRLYYSWFFPYSHSGTCSWPTAGNCGCLLATAIKVWGIAPGICFCGVNVQLLFPGRSGLSTVRYSRLSVCL